MKKIMKLAIVAFMMVGFTATNSFADAVKGQKLYLKKYKKSCGVTGAVMAAKHTQAEWTKIKEDGKFEDEIKALCPDVKSVKDKYQDDIFDFFHKYASDSGNVPSC
jgi:phage tail protein X